MKNILESQFFRYLFAAGLATLVDMSVYYIMMTYVLHGAHFWSLAFSFTAGLFTNFGISKYFVFQKSKVQTNSQFLRFVGICVIVFAANFYYMEFLRWLLPQMIPVMLQAYSKLILHNLFIRGFSAACIAVLSFTMHKFVTFEDPS